jgi:histidinol-phosphate aminotransferase
MVLQKLGDPGAVDQQIRDIAQQKDRLIKGLEQLNLVKEVFPSAANFLLVRVDDADSRYHELLGAGIVVRNRSKQPLCEDCLRITVGTAQQNQRLLNALKNMDQ